MLVQTAKSNNSVQLIMLFVAALLLWGKALLLPVNECASSTSLVYNFLFGGIAGNPVVAALLGFVLLLSETIFLIHIFHINKLTKNAYFTGLIYFLLMSSNPVLLTLNPVQIAAFFLIASLYCIFKIYDSKEPYQYIFDAAFLLSIASFFYFPALLMMIGMWIVMIAYTLNKWREWVISLIGIVMPYFLFVSLLYLTNNFELVYYIHFEQLTSAKLYFSYTENIYFLGFMSFVTILSILSVLFVQKNIIDIEIYQRKKIVANTILMVVAFVVLFMSPYYMRGFSIVYIYAAYFIAEYLTRTKRKIIAEILFLIILLFIIAENYNLL